MVIAISLGEACIKFKFLALPNSTEGAMGGEDGGLFSDDFLCLNVFSA
jgi:hypothetical protein